MKKDLVKKELSQTIKQMAKNRDYSSITVLSLCRECGISRSTFYNHFMDIYDLINWTLETDVVEPLQRHIRTHSMGGWHGITRYCLQKMYDEKDFYCKAIRYDGQNCLRDYLLRKNLESWQLLIRRYMEDTGKKCDPETLDFFLRYTSQAIGNMIIRWALDGMKTPVALMARMDDLATEGIYNSLGQAPDQ